MSQFRRNLPLVCVVIKRRCINGAGQNRWSWFEWRRPSAYFKDIDCLRRGVSLATGISSLVWRCDSSQEGPLCPFSAPSSILCFVHPFAYPPNYTLPVLCASLFKNSVFCHRAMWWSNVYIRGLGCSLISIKINQSLICSSNLQSTPYKKFIMRNL